MQPMLPYASLQFFELYGVFVLLLFISKYLLQRVLPYRIVIFLGVIGYVVLGLPVHFRDTTILFVVYSYVVYRMLKKFLAHQVLLPMLIIVVPMTLFKLDVSPFYRIIGISYMTFRISQAVVDRKNYGELSFIDFIIFLLLPTTLLAGPIDRSYRLTKDLDRGYDGVTIPHLIEGWEIFLVGVLFKFIIATFVQRYWLSPIDTQSTFWLTIIHSAYAYNVFLFFDFAGYSALAVGLGKMIGIDTPMNFDKPYLAQNPQDFWRRFHITLGTWLTDYFFKPIYLWLNGKKRLQGKRLLMQNSAIIATFLLMGIWNGFRWYYIVSGFLFGLYSAVHNWYVLYVRKGGFDFFMLFSPPLQVWVKRFLMFHFAVGALYVFSGRVPV